MSIDAKRVSEISGNMELLIRRWAATIIDLLVFCILFIVLKFFLSEFYTIISLVIIYFAYYTLVEGITGYTIGKYLIKIRVVNLYYQPPGILKNLVRTLLRMIEVNPLLLGAIPAGICVASTKTKQRLGDMLVKTYVIRTYDFPSSVEEETRSH